MTGRGKNRPIIVKRKATQTNHALTGSWKIAYADFFVALMAFFLVMWIMGMDAEARDLIQGYFSNPVGFKKAYGSGSSPLSSGEATLGFGAQNTLLLGRDYQRGRFEAASAEIQSMLDRELETRDLSDNVAMIVGDDGLRIELAESEGRAALFETASARLTLAAHEVLGIIAHVLSQLANPIVLEGHTDATQYGKANYSNWELSTDRAHAARRVLIERGVSPGRIAEVRGYADRRPRELANPGAPANRRVSILLPYDRRAGPRAITPPTVGLAAPADTGVVPGS